MDPKTTCLACCIERARRLADGDQSSTSEVYWHTREAVMAQAGRLGIPVQEVLRAVSALTYQENITRGPRHRTVSGRTINMPQELVSLSEPMWADVAHPSVLVEEVMSS